jgi:Bacterial antitoxin of type II TA system, VapB
MKTTVDIPDDALHALMSFTGADTKRAAIVQAVNDFNQRQRMAKLTKYAGTFKDFMAQDDLSRMREDGKQPW